MAFFLFNFEQIVFFVRWTILLRVGGKHADSGWCRFKSSHSFSAAWIFQQVQKFFQFCSSVTKTTACLWIMIWSSNYVKYSNGINKIFFLLSALLLLLPERRILFRRTWSHIGLVLTLRLVNFPWLTSVFFESDNKIIRGCWVILLNNEINAGISMIC